jgi:hypothetical protein
MLSIVVVVCVIEIRTDDESELRVVLRPSATEMKVNDVNARNPSRIFNVSMMMEEL